ncbi:methyl-accepting chemotaxis protein [Aromatoleum sp.]|uniref:methyl-accepting chemotaxis protein n=1 Tax=Aromatoleum sp. TaxID=2307007 RepID=UPI002FC8DACB
MALKPPKLSLSTSKKSFPEDAAVATTIMESPRRAPARAAKKRPNDKARTASDRIGLLGIAFALVSIVGLGLIFYQFRESANATTYTYAAGEMETLSQRIAKAAQLSLQGKPEAFAELRDSTRRFGELLGALDQGGTIDGDRIPAAPSSAREQIDALAATWAPVSEDAGQLIAQEKNLLELNRSVASINAQDAALLEQAEQLAQYRLQAGAGPREVAGLASGVALTQRIAKNANALLVANTIDPQTAFALGKDTKGFADLVAELKQTSVDPESRRRLQGLDESAGNTIGAVTAIMENIQALVQAKHAGSRILEAAEPLTARAGALSETLNNAYRGLTPATIGIAVVALVGLGILSLMARINNAEIAARRAEAEAHQKSAEEERNQAQQAILRLMNEMGDLADGDLTVRTTVSEDITGAIADSVNYTIEELSVLVRRINDAASRLTAATESAQRTSTELLGATERQSTEIKEAGATVQQMAQSMTESSGLALRSAQVARRSLDSARKGAGAVENTIKGMNGIREQIQETSKRIKRLGESSQEIGEIVELISDITEQTNVLALNAAIQAASAGEAGRGFTVVAEEVQRLAERSGEATKQIAAIVKTIQTDTKDAVGSMENATRDVVEGAQLSDAAGQALAEIGDVSLEAARLIEQISSDTQHQAATASRVAGTMQDILAITEQTARGTQQTAGSVGQLADLAVELKGSVSGFKV